MFRQLPRATKLSKYTPWRGISTTRLPARSFSSGVAIAGLTSVLLLGYYSRDKASINLEAKKPLVEIRSKDIDTGVEFPNHIQSDSKELNLLGLGVRTVSFLRVKVYSLGIYADESAQRALLAIENVKEKLATTATPDNDQLVGEKLMESVIKQSSFAVRIIPVRNTDFGHLRDGFIRAVQARMKAVQIDAEEAQQVNESLQTFKSYFPSSKVPKGNDLTLTKTSTGDLILSYNGDTLGKLDSRNPGVAFISTQLLLAYFADKNPISSKAKNSVINRL